MNLSAETIPALEERFTEPPGWRWHQFTRQGLHGPRRIRFGSVFPESRIPDAVVVCLPGLSEYAEKYFEIARSCLDKNLAFWVLDWMGQGTSGRYLQNPHKRHSAGVEEDVADLHYFILEYIKHSSVHPDKGRIPLAMLGHSMGANIGLHYLHAHPGMFECAAFSAPFFGFKMFEGWPCPLPVLAARLLNTFSGSSYASGQGDWDGEDRKTPGEDAFSSDPVRGAVHNVWMQNTPSLQIGGVTYGWIYSFVQSCRALRRPSFLKSIQTPCLLAEAGQETLVSNRAIHSVSSRLPHAELIDFPESRHEILMEKDAVRTVFFDHFYKLIRECIIERPETLKPF